MSDSFDRGNALYHARRYSLAAEEFRRALSETPGSGPALVMLALTLKALGKSGAAYDAAAEAIRLNPGSSNALFTMAIIRMTFWPSAGDAPAPPGGSHPWFIPSRGLVLRALQLDPEDPDYCALLGKIEALMCDHEASLKTADRGLTFKPDHVGCLLVRARALFNIGLPAASVDVVREILRINPENPEAYAIWGQRLIRSGDVRQAARLLAESLRLDPNQEATRRILRRTRLAEKFTAGWIVRRARQWFRRGK